MQYKYLAFVVFIFSLSCETEDVEPISPIDPVDPTEILGCLDINAVNYNADANTDNGCCQYSNLLLNEVLYDPPNGLEGDANGDGVRDPNDDEFVELINVSNSNLDISGYEFYDNTNLSSGMPNHIVPPGTILAPMKAYVPIVIPQIIVLLAPIVAPFFTIVFLYSFFRLISDLGLITLVKTMLGPQKTLSSKVTSSNMDTLFCTFTFLPITTLEPIKTFCPKEDSSPIFAPLQTWTQCHILTWLPIFAPSSIIEVE